MQSDVPMSHPSHHTLIASEEGAPYYDVSLEHLNSRPCTSVPRMAARCNNVQYDLQLRVGVSAFCTGWILQRGQPLFSLKRGEGLV
jgi:hypothetical protein